MHLIVDKDSKNISLSGNNFSKDDNGGLVLKEDGNQIRALKALRILGLRKIKDYIIKYCSQFVIFMPDNSNVLIGNATDADMNICIQQLNQYNIPDKNYSLNDKETLFKLAIDILQPLLAKVDDWFSEDIKRNWSDFLRNLNNTKPFYNELMDSINVDAVRNVTNKAEPNFDNDDDFLAFTLHQWAEDHLNDTATIKYNALLEESNKSLQLLQIEKQKMVDNLLVFDELKQQHKHLQEKNYEMKKNIDTALAHQQVLQAENTIEKQKNAENLLVFDDLKQQKQLLQQQNIELKENVNSSLAVQTVLQSETKMTVDKLMIEQELRKQQDLLLNEKNESIIQLTKELSTLNEKFIYERQQYSPYKSSTPSIASSSPTKRKLDLEQFSDCGEMRAARNCQRIDFRQSLFRSFCFPSSMYFTAQLHYQNLLFVVEEQNFDDTSNSLFKCVSIQLLGHHEYHVNYKAIKAAFFQYVNNNEIEEDYQVTEKDIKTIINNFNIIFKSFLSYPEQYYIIQVWEYTDEQQLQCFRSGNVFSSIENNNIYLLYYIDPINNDFKFRIVKPLQIFYEK